MYRVHWETNKQFETLGQPYSSINILLLSRSQVITVSQPIFLSSFNAHTAVGQLWLHCSIF